MLSPDPRVQRLVALFENLKPADLDRLGEFYAGGASFKDPFNEVQGVPAIRRVFEHMFVALDAPRLIAVDVRVGHRRTLLVGGSCLVSCDGGGHRMLFSRV